VVDLEQRKPIDLLNGRSSFVLDDWLRKHPSIEIIMRDRSKAYKAGIDVALPEAIQVADRWHLYVNLRQRLEQIIAKERRREKSEAKTTNNHRKNILKLFVICICEDIRRGELCVY
jgi:transposase